MDFVSFAKCSNNVARDISKESHHALRIRRKVTNHHSFLLLTAFLLWLWAHWPDLGLDEKRDGRRIVTVLSWRH
jgi:hypothetical protein